MTGGFDPGRYTTAPLQTEGVVRFAGSLDAVFTRIANHAAMTDWVPLLKTVQVSHPKSLPPGESMVGTARVLSLRGGVIIREEVVYWDSPRCYAYTTEGKRWPLRDYVGFMGVQEAPGGGAFVFREYFCVDGALRRALVSPGIVLVGKLAIRNLSKLIGGTSAEFRRVPSRLGRRVSSR
jgi:Polyketide cyclase / dehydrase and lipid transport